MALEELFKDLGGFSWFQLVMITCVYTMKLATSWSMIQMAFAGLIPDYICHVDQSEADNVSQSNMASLTQVYGNDSLNVCSVNGTSCQEFVFQGTARTVITEWNLVCDLKWIKATVTSLQMAGVLVGALLAGHCGDYFGRKKTLYSAYFVHAICNLVTAFSVSWVMFGVMRFFIGVFVGAVLVVAVPYPAEFLPLKWRAIIPAIPMWSLGVGFFACAAYFLEDWTYLHMACAAIAVPNFLGVFYMPESVRWLTVHDRRKEAYDVIKKMARVNGRPVPAYTKEVIEEIAQEERQSRPNQRAYSYIDLFRGKRMAITTLIFAFHWISFSVIFYGLSFGVSSLAGNIYFNIFLMNILDLPTYPLTFWLANRLGRRWTSFGYLAIGGTAAFACLGVRMAGLKENKDIIISALSLTAKAASNAAWVASQIWVVEVYPTVTRSLGYGFANTAARIGGMLAPFAVNLDDMVVFSYVLMGSLFILCVITVFFVPETKDTALAETMHTENKEQSKVKSDIGQGQKEDNEMGSM